MLRLILSGRARHTCCGHWINSSKHQPAGSYKIQGKDKDQVDQLIKDGLAFKKLAPL